MSGEGSDEGDEEGSSEPIGRGMAIGKPGARKKIKPNDKRPNLPDCFHFAGVYANLSWT